MISVDMCYMYSTDGVCVTYMLKNNGRSIASYSAISVIELVLSFITVKHTIKINTLNEVTSSLRR